MLDTIRMHSRNGRLLAGVAAGTVLVIVGQMILAGQWSELVRYSGPLGIFLLLAWAALWSPYVECSPAGVKLHNVLSTIMLPWPTIQAVDGRYGLTLDTVYGEFTAWSASRPRLRPGPVDPDAPRDPVTEVTRTWTAMQAAGHLDDPRIEPDVRPRQWRVGVIELLVALMLWTAASLTLTQ